MRVFRYLKSARIGFRVKTKEKISLSSPKKFAGMPFTILHRLSDLNSRATFRNWEESEIFSEHSNGRHWVWSIDAIKIIAYFCQIPKSSRFNRRTAQFQQKQFKQHRHMNVWKYIGCIWKEIYLCCMCTHYTRDECYRKRTEPNRDRLYSNKNDSQSSMLFSVHPETRTSIYSIRSLQTWRSMTSSNEYNKMLSKPLRVLHQDRNEKILFAWLLPLRFRIFSSPSEFVVQRWTRSANQKSNVIFDGEQTEII